VPYGVPFLCCIKPIPTHKQATGLGISSVGEVWALYLIPHIPSLCSEAGYVNAPISNEFAGMIVLFLAHKEINCIWGAGCSGKNYATS
jgi:hypothetical protein